MSEGVSALCIWGKGWLMVLCAGHSEQQRTEGKRTVSWEKPRVCTLRFCARAAVL